MLCEPPCSTLVVAFVGCIVLQFAGSSSPGVVATTTTSRRDDLPSPQSGLEKVSSAADRGSSSSSSTSTAPLASPTKLSTARKKHDVESVPPPTATSRSMLPQRQTVTVDVALDVGPWLVAAAFALCLFWYWCLFIAVLVTLDPQAGRPDSMNAAPEEENSVSSPSGGVSWVRRYRSALWHTPMRCVKASTAVASDCCSRFQQSTGGWSRLGDGRAADDDDGDGASPTDDEIITFRAAEPHRR